MPDGFLLAPERRAVRGRFFLVATEYEDDMTAPNANRHRKSMLIRWFGPNRNTHWTIAGSVAVIMLGGYLVYSNRDSNPTTAAPISAPERTQLPMGPAPLKSEK
jgi:hypothetical protein